MSLGWTWQEVEIRVSLEMPEFWEKLDARCVEAEGHFLP